MAESIFDESEEIEEVEPVKERDSKNAKAENAGDKTLHPSSSKPSNSQSSQ